jgi:hypothetical protein
MAWKYDWKRHSEFWTEIKSRTTSQGHSTHDLLPEEHLTPAEEVNLQPLGHTNIVRR